MQDGQDTETHGGLGGADALAGYDYQTDVSIWLALDLMLASKLTDQIELEPATQEDLEARLDEHDAGRPATRIGMKGYTLVVQAKRRSGDAWTVGGLTTLLTHGGPNRRSAAERLKSPDVRYLLVTSATLNGGARNVQVRTPGLWPKAGALPPSMASALPPDAAGRIAAIVRDEEKLETDIQRLLTERFGVPVAHREDCLRELREEARLRMRRVGEGRWSREAIETVVRSHGGYLAAKPELENYVLPTNWPTLRGAIAEHHAAIIIGQSGTGKTLATRKLYDELRREIPGLKRVPILLGPQELAADQTPGPVLYDIEDPWGRYDFDPEKRPWNDQLSRFLSQARPDRMLIVTTRRDVGEASGALNSVVRWLVPLEAEHYGLRERRRLYRSRIEGLPRELQRLAASSEPEVLEKLATPLEIQKFFDALRTLDREGLQNPSLFVSDAIARAHQDAIEQTTIDQIGHRDDIRAAAVLWGLLKASDRLSLSLLRQIEGDLADRDPVMDRGVQPLIDFFIAARNLRSPDNGVTAYYHPRVEAGVERALLARPLIARKSLSNLVEVLTSISTPDPDWGLATAARIVAAARAKDLALSLSPHAVQKIDGWLVKQLTSEEKTFKTDLELAAAVGSPDCDVAELARWLMHRPDRSFPGFMDWGLPGQDDEWYARLRANSAVKAVLTRFIRDIVPDENAWFRTDFLTGTDRLADNLDDAWLGAAQSAVHRGYSRSTSLIADGALRDLDGFEPIVDLAVKAVTPSKGDDARHAQQRLDIINDVYGEDYAESLAHDDEGTSAHQLLDSYVEALRTTRGWRALSAHRHAAVLQFRWIRLLSNATWSSPDEAEEISSLFEVALGGPNEAELWPLITSGWDVRYRQPLIDRLFEGHPKPAVRRAALATLSERAADALPALCERLQTHGRYDRLIELSIDIAHLRPQRRAAARPAAKRPHALMGSLPPVYGELAEAERALILETHPALGSKALAVLAAAPGESPDVRTLRIKLSPLPGLPVEDDVRWILDNLDDPDVALIAINAAIRLKMTPIVEAGMDHRFACVVVRAMETLAAPLAAPLPTAFLAKADARPSPTRKALVSLLAERPHRAHVETLLQLSTDTWSNDARYYGDDAEYPIARAALRALPALGPFEPEQYDRLFSLALDTDDPMVRSLAFDLLALTGGTTQQRRLLHLAVAPGRGFIRRDAAGALLDAHEMITQDILDDITSDRLLKAGPGIASRLALLIAVQAPLPIVMARGRLLAESPRRRVLVLLILAVVVDRDANVTEEIAALLPPAHLAVPRARGTTALPLTEANVADLGEALICAEVLSWLNVLRPPDNEP